MNTFETIKNHLDDKNFFYLITDHAPVRTSEEAAIIRGHTKEEGMKRGAKAMIIRSEGKFYQFVLPGDKKLDFRKIKAILKTQSASLATPNEVERSIGCTPGAVPPFGSLFNIKTYVDKHLLTNDEIDFNAGKHTVSITMNVKDWVKVVQPIEEEFVADQSY